MGFGSFTCWGEETHRLSMTPPRMNNSCSIPGLLDPGGGESVQAPAWLLKETHPPSDRMVLGCDPGPGPETAPYCSYSRAEGAFSGTAMPTQCGGFRKNTCLDQVLSQDCGCLPQLQRKRDILCFSGRGSSDPQADTGRFSSQPLEMHQH